MCRVETPLAAAHDAASRTFWRNVAARSAHEQVTQKLCMPLWKALAGS
jgi:hypothetical protein